MIKEEFKAKREIINSKIRELNNEMMKLKKEYIKSNENYPIGSKVCLTIPAHTVRILCDSKTKTIPEEKKFAYVTGYEIVSNEVVPILMKAKKDGTISKLREYIPLYFLMWLATGKGKAVFFCLRT